ncbi:hypothetical protein [Sphingomonas sp. CFBP 8760]|uniref:hypothetical protein n=1 Tax=Sphingomonas sp. CFBP 8760 TaxID=2775282 RepID=UPI001A90FDE2|nr:hypothetical protein [Sphingomonas sp. CFBP 8760]
MIVTDGGVAELIAAFAGATVVVPVHVTVAAVAVHCAVAGDELSAAAQIVVAVPTKSRALVEKRIQSPYFFRIRATPYRRRSTRSDAGDVLRPFSTLFCGGAVTAVTQGM